MNKKKMTLKLSRLSVLKKSKIGSPVNPISSKIFLNPISQFYRIHIFRNLRLKFHNPIVVNKVYKSFEDREYPSLDKKENIPKCTFSSSKNFILCSNQSNSPSSQISGEFQSRFNMPISQIGISLNDLLSTTSSFKHFKNYGNHHSSSFKNRLSMTNFIICNNILINLDSHNLKKNKKVFKHYETKIKVKCLKNRRRIVISEPPLDCEKKRNSEYNYNSFVKKAHHDLKYNKLIETNLNRGSLLASFISLINLPRDFAFIKETSHCNYLEFSKEVSNAEK